VAKKSKTKKIFLGCLGVVLILILVAIGSVLYVLSSVFDEKPAEIVIKVPEPEPLLSGTQKLLKALGGGPATSGNPGIGNTSLEDLDLNSLGLGNLEAVGADLGELDLNNLENIDPEELLKKLDLGKVMEALAKPGKITLSKAEVNALIASYFTADKVGDFQDPNKPKVYDAYFANGRFTLKLAVDSKFPSPFGSYCNIELVFIPQVVDHHLKLDLYSVRAGTLSIPVSYFKDTIDSKLREYEQSDDGKLLLQMVTSLKVEEDKVVMEYDFQYLSLYLLENQHKLEILNNSSEMSADEILKIFK
jgi:uncharacterized protein YpmS